MLKTRVCELLRIDHPIISAPMGSAADAALAAAVSEAGGFGLIGMGTRDDPVWLRDQIRDARARTTRPFGVGFISSFPRIKDFVQVALDEGVAAVSHSFADPSPYIPAAHAAGVKVLAQVQTVAQAVTAARAGADIVVAQGTEAGGHTGHSGGLAFLPAVVDAIGDHPVVAAGGIADGRGLAAVLILGADGAWVGTRFIACHESASPPWAKQRVVEASADDTVLTKAYDLAMAWAIPESVGDRVLRNDYTAAWHHREADVRAKSEGLRAHILEAMTTGNTRIAAVRAGVASGLIQGVESAADIVRRMVDEAETILRARPKDLLRS
jgi:nitronate monooxygenase